MSNNPLSGHACPNNKKEAKNARSARVVIQNTSIYYLVRIFKVKVKVKVKCPALFDHPWSASKAWFYFFLICSTFVINPFKSPYLKFLIYFLKKYQSRKILIIFLNIYRFNFYLINSRYHV